MEETAEMQLRILIRGFKAAMRWPYEPDMINHIADPESAKGKGYDRRYLADIDDMHRAFEIARKADV